MIIGVPKEIKVQEYRVALVPSGVKQLKEDGHRILVEKDAGNGSLISNKDFERAGAQIVDSKDDIFDNAQMIIKVKEPLPEEFNFFHEGQILFAFLHLASSKSLTLELMKKGITGIAYETIQLDDGSLPMLMPMSEIAGKMSIQIGMHFLQRDKGGKGLLLSGVPGVRKGKVTILGGGVAGFNATKVAVGLGSQITLFDINHNRLTYIDDIFRGRVMTLMSNPHDIAKEISESDLLVGSVLIPGARAPRLVTREMIKEMEKGSVVVDLSIDQGGCIETIRETTHDNPIYEVDGIIHYGVTNVPGAVPITSTYALTNTTVSYARKISALGIEQAIEIDNSLRKGVNIWNGKLVNQAVCDAFGLKCEHF